MHPRASQCLWLLGRSREVRLQSRRSERSGRLRRSALCRARRGLRAQARVSSRDRPDHPLVSLLVIAKAIDAAGNQSKATKTVHRPLHDRSIDEGILAFRTSRNASHASCVARAYAEFAEKTTRLEVGWEYWTKSEPPRWPRSQLASDWNRPTAVYDEWNS